MALNWDITKCENIPADWREPNPDYDANDPTSKPDQWTDEGWAIVQKAIWSTLITNHGWELTEANAATFYSRQYLWSQMHDETALTPEQVHALIGLSTNVSPMADQTWRGRYIKAYEEEKRRGFFKKSGIDPKVNKPVKAAR